jgi:uncharacterized protein (DUF2147 family)
MIARLLLPVTLVSVPVFAAGSPAGSWLTDTKDGIIEIAPCGPRMCGKLARSLVPIKGPPFDRNNPDPALRTRPLIGLPVLTGFVPQGGTWRGTAYDPKAGRSYNTTLERIAPGRLKVKGCIAFFCRTVIWTRAE